ncbi:MAG: L,D-transpeptidase [Polyangiales bacterium]
MRALLPFVLLCACQQAEPPQPPEPKPVQQQAVAEAGADASADVESDAGDAVSDVATDAVVAASGPQISTSRFLSWIYEKPKTDAQHSGWMRAGAKLRRAESPTAGTGCNGKWWAVEPGGFVCEGQEGVTTDMNDAVVTAAAMRPPERCSPFPYGYATSQGSPLYLRVPTAAQQKMVEKDLDAHLAAVAAARAKGDEAKLPPVSALPIGPIPSFLENGAMVPNVLGGKLPNGIVIAESWKTMRLSMLSAFESEGRLFYFTSEHFVVPADRFRAARLADFHGVDLAKEGEAGEHLPMVWVRWKPVKLHKLENGHAVQTEQTLEFQAHAQIAPKERNIDGTRFFELLSGPGEGTWLVRADPVTRIDALTELPYMVGADDLWIDVSLHRQTLVLYRGLRPIFVTLVSTGVDVDGDPETSRATPKGHFRIHSKHVSWRMAADEKPPAKEGAEPDARYRIDDVPFVQYFQAGYALHAAFWHDSFGQPKSHGCINLSPRDALYMFGQTEPKVPDTWHGVYSGRSGAPLGTTLIVRN